MFPFSVSTGVLLISHLFLPMRNIHPNLSRTIICNNCCQYWRNAQDKSWGASRIIGRVQEPSFSLTLNWFNMRIKQKWVFGAVFLFSIYLLLMIGSLVPSGNFPSKMFKSSVVFIFKRWNLPRQITPSWLRCSWDVLELGKYVSVEWENIQWGITSTCKGNSVFCGVRFTRLHLRTGWSILSRSTKK